MPDQKLISYKDCGNYDMVRYHGEQDVVVGIIRWKPETARYHFIPDNLPLNEWWKIGPRSRRADMDAALKIAAHKQRQQQQRRAA